MLLTMQSKQQTAVSDILGRFRDAFSNACVGGSYARKAILGSGDYSDIDIYVSLWVARYMVRDIIEKVVLHDFEITWKGEHGTTPGNKEYYKMPYITKRLTFSAYRGGVGHLYFDFIVLNPVYVKNIPLYLQSFQASTISECCLEVNFHPTGYSEHTTPAFRDMATAIENNTPYILRVNHHESVCTEGHKIKIRQFAEKYPNLVINPIQYKKYDTAVFKTQQRAKALDF